MARVERDWLRRIPGGVWTERPVRRRKPGEPGGGDEGDGDALAPDANGEPVEAEEDAQADAEAQADEAREDAEDTPPNGEPGPGDAPPDGDADAERADADGAEGEAPPPDEMPLDVPEEVERRRKEEEAKRRRGALNRHLAPQAFGLEGHYLRALAHRFARMISKVAEDSADLPAEGDDEWDLDELLRRRFTGRLVSQCRMTREKRKVAVVLDTSPSCEHQARLFGSIARIAEELGDCELFDAPNFAIMARKLDDAWEHLPEAEREWGFQGRAVLAFGDFDGIDRISAASRVRGNRIYWFCCEERPPVLEAGRETLVKQYRGRYYPATNLHELLHAVRRVR